MKKPASQNPDQDHFRQSISLRDPRFRDRLQRETGITITFWDEHPAEELHLDRAWWSIHPPEEIVTNLKLLVLLCEKFGRYPYLLREQPEWRPHFLYDNPKWQRFAHDLDGYVRLCRLLAEVCRSRKINSKPLRELADWSEDWFKRFSQAEPKKWNEAHSEWKSRHDHVEAHIDRLRTRLALELKKGPQITAGEYEDDGRKQSGSDGDDEGGAENANGAKRNEELNPYKEGAEGGTEIERWAIRAFKLVICDGKKQTEAAEVIEQERRLPTSQGQVSRWVSKVKDYMKTRGVSIEQFKSQYVTWDNRTIDLGNRQDGRHPPMDNDVDRE